MFEWQGPPPALTPW